MACTRLSSVLLVVLFTSPVSAQQGSEDDDDLDVVASETLVRELRSERQAAEQQIAELVPGATADERLVGSAQALDRMIEQGCELHPMSRARILGLESLLASVSSQERELRDLERELERQLGEEDVRELKLALIDARQRALRDCCEEESAVCFE